MRAHHLNPKALNTLEQLTPRDEGGQEQVAQRPVLEQQRPQRVAIDRDVAQRLGDDRVHEDGLAGEQVELSEEAGRAVAGELVAGLVDDRHLALDDRDERVPLIADAIQHVADLRRPLLAELAERLQLRRGQPWTGGTRHETKGSRRSASAGLREERAPDRNIQGWPDRGGGLTRSGKRQHLQGFPMRPGRFELPRSKRTTRPQPCAPPARPLLPPPKRRFHPG